MSFSSEQTKLSYKGVCIGQMSVERGFTVFPFLPLLVQITFLIFLKLILSLNL